MKKVTFIFLVLCSLAIASGTAYAYFFYIPKKVEETVIKSFNSLGFEQLAYDSIQHKRGKIIIHHITLDKGRFSTIKKIQIEFSLLKFLIDPHYAQSITVDGMSLTGDVSNDLDIRIAGWDNSKTIINNLQKFPAGTIIFENASVDLLTENIGGINMKYNARMMMDKSGEITFKARVNSTQKKLIYNAKVDGKITPDSNIALNADLENISVNMPNISIRRGTGKMNTQYVLNSEKPFLKIFSDLQLASLRWYGMPLSNVKLNVERSPDNYEIALDGSTFGTKPIKWKSTIKPSTEITQSETTITPTNLVDVYNFFSSNKKLSLKADIPDMVLNLDAPAISISNTINNETGETEGTLKFSLSSPDIDLIADYNSEEGVDNILGTIKLNKTVIKTTPNHDTEDKTHFDVSAFGEFTIKNYDKSPEAEWFIHVDIHDGDLDFEALTIPGIAGSVIIGGNKKTSNSKSLPFKLALKPSIRQKGLLGINLDNKDKPILDHILFKIYSGQIRTESPIVRDGIIQKKNTLIVSDINITQLIKDAGFVDVSVTGTLAGRIPFNAKNNEINVNGALLQSQNTGILKLPENMITGLFPGDSKKMQNIREALTNYHYEYFEIRFDGDMADRVMMTLNASGINPDSGKKDPVELHLQIETQISLLFENLQKK